MVQNLYIVSAKLADGTRVTDSILAESEAEARHKGKNHWVQSAIVEDVFVSVKDYKAWQDANFPKTNSKGEWKKKR